MMRIYIVEDSPYLLEDSILCLNAQGFDCYGAPDARSFTALISERLPDVVILDWMLPDESGLSIAKKLRENEQTKKIGIAFLTARSDIGDRITGLAFADAYHVKPIDYQELGAVITSIYRRTATTEPISTEPLWRLDTKRLTLKSPTNKTLILSHREFILLRQLAQTPNIPVSAKQIIESWGENWMIFEKNRLELLLSRLRGKIKAMSEDTLNPVRAIRNHGYQLVIKVQIYD